MHEARPQKCYNSFSCILSVLIVVFVLGSILFDLCVTKPNISRNITEIRTELNVMNEKIDKFNSTMIVPIDTVPTINTIEK